MTPFILTCTILFAIEGLIAGLLSQMIRPRLWVSLYALLCFGMTAWGLSVLAQL